MKTLLGLFAVLVLVAAIAAGGWMLARKNEVTPEIARLERELTAARGEIAKLNEELAAERKTATVSRLENNPSETPSVTAAAPARTAKESGAAGGKGMMSEMRKVMQDPGMKEMVRHQSKMQIEMLYGKLFEHFQLTPEEKENFKELLASRQAAQTDMGFKMVEENITPAQQTKITADYEATRKANDELIKTFLGDDADFATFKHWEDTQPERMTYEMMGGRAHFDSTGEPLSPDQEQLLIDTMAGVRMAPSKLPDLNKPENFQPSNMTEDMITAQMQKLDVDAQRVLQEVAKFLSPAQIDGLKNFQKSARTMSEAGLKMSSSMLQGGADK